MNVFGQITRKTLLKNKSRTIVTLIGVILTVAMITAVTTLMTSFRSYLLKTEERNSGSWHIMYENQIPEEEDDLKNNKKVKSTASVLNLGSALLEKSDNEMKPYLLIAGLSATDESMLSIQLLSGRMPKNSQEIILPEHLAENGNVHFSTGDIVELEVGDRSIDGLTLSRNEKLVYGEGSDDKIIYEEKLENLRNRKFTVVGFYERPIFENYSAAGYTALTLPSEEEMAKAPRDVFFQLEDVKETFEFLNEEESYDVNTVVLGFQGVSRYNSFGRLYTGLFSIFIVIIMLASISLIYNAFAISVADRTKQFGLLSSIGASKKQLQSTVILEALYISLIGIPIGIFSGLLGIYVTFKFVGPRFTQLSPMINPPELQMLISYQSILAATLLSLVTILISAWIPARRASKVSAIDAIRNTREFKAKSVRVSKWNYKLFGLPALISAKYYKRSRSRYRATIISISMSIILFLAAIGFIDNLKVNALSFNSMVEYQDVYFTIDGVNKYGALNEVIEEIKTIESVDQASFFLQVNSMYMIPLIDTSLMSDVAIESQPFKISGKTPFNVPDVTFVDDKLYWEMAEPYGLTKENSIEETDGESVFQALVYDYFSRFDTINGRMENLKALTGKSGIIEFYTYEEKDGFGSPNYYFEELANENVTELSELKVGYQEDSKNKNQDEGVESKIEAFAFEEVAEPLAKVNMKHFMKEAPAFIMDGSGVYIFLPYSALDKFIGDKDSSSFWKSSTADIMIQAEEHALAMRESKQNLLDQDCKISIYQDLTDESEKVDSLLLIINVFTFGFITLISLIGIANVFNTITTNIQLRRRDFASLDSIGMDFKGKRKMMIYESFLYSIKGLLFGLPIGLFFNFLISAVMREINDYGFKIPFASIGFVIISVFVIILISMGYALQRLKKINIIETIRRENI